MPVQPPLPPLDEVRLVDAVLDDIVPEMAFNPNLLPPIVERNVAVNVHHRIRNPIPVGEFNRGVFADAVMDFNNPVAEVEFNPPIKRVQRAIQAEILDKQSLSYALGRVVPGRFGFELEVEGENLPSISGEWDYKKDGSLRGENLEYVLHHPVNLPEFIPAFETLVKKLTRASTKLNFSFRTSIHVHLNVLDFNKNQIQALFYLSHLVEDVLVNYSGDTRIGNRFCLRTKDAMWKVSRFKKWLTEPGFGRLNQDDLKYSAINIATMLLYGSIEFRSMRGTVDKNVVLPWMEVINNLYEIAKIVPIAEMEAIARDKPIEILNVVFKEHLPLFTYPDMEKDVIEAYDRLIEIPYVKVRQ